MSEKRLEGKLYQKMKQHVENTDVNMEVYLLPSPRNTLSQPSKLTKSEQQGIFLIPVNYLDEAKADFPRAIFPDDAGPEYFQTAKDLLADIQEWFLKHFGEP
jgi:hypothetical protein